MSQYSSPPSVHGSPLRPHRGAMILVLGILGLVICFILGIIAWVMASGDLRQMDAGLMDPSGRGLTQAGKILGIVATVLNLIAFVFVTIPMILAIIAAIASGAGGTGP